MCSVDSFRKKFADRTTDDIFRELRRGRELGFEAVEFTGGEPPVRPDFLMLVGEARKLGYKIINTGTNGRLFSYDKFCHEAFRRGLTGVNFSLHGSSAKLHDAITRTPGSFNQTIAGIKNVLKESSLKSIYLLSVIFRLNIGDIENLIKLMKSLGIQKWNPLNLIPEGAAESRYKRLAVSFGEIAEKFEDNLRFLRLMSEVYFFDFPKCVFSSAFMADGERFRFIAVKEREEHARQVGYGVKSFQKIRGLYIDERRRRLLVCRHCRYFEDCGGIWNEYVKIFGAKESEKEIADLARKNNCLIS